MVQWVLSPIHWRVGVQVWLHRGVKIRRHQHPPHLGDSLGQRIGVVLQVGQPVVLDRMCGEVRQVQGAWGLVLEVWTVLVVLGLKVPTALVARVVCTLVAVAVQPILGVAGHLGSSEVSDGGCRGTPLPLGSVCGLLMPASCPW